MGMAFQDTVLPGIPETVETYAETGVDFELTLRSMTQPFPTARVAAAFSGNDLRPAQIDTTDRRIEVYTLTLYDPPEDVTYVLKGMLSKTGPEIVEREEASD